MNRISGLGRHYLRERPGRAFLVTFSVVLGVTVVVAVGAGTATLDRGINRFGTSIANADVIATNAGAFGSRLSSSAPTDLAALDGVQVAAPVTANTDAVITRWQAGP